MCTPADLSAIAFFSPPNGSAIGPLATARGMAAVEAFYYAEATKNMLANEGVNYAINMY